MSLDHNDSACVSNSAGSLPLRSGQLRITIVPASTELAAQIEINPPNMFGIPCFRLERVPPGNRHLEPGWTYVVSRGRGRNKKKFFVRAKSGRERGRQPPIVYIDDRDPVPPYDPGPYPRCDCNRCREGYVYHCERLPGRRRLGRGEWDCHGYHRDGYLETIPEEPRSFRRSDPGSRLSPDLSARATTRNHVGTQTATSPDGRHVHWVDGRSDGALSPVPSLVSDNSTDSDDDGGVACPRTPSSSPERRSCRPTIIEREPTRYCRYDEARGNGHLRYGGGPRHGCGHSRRNWREAPCWDDDLGMGVVREPRF
jgi:hypothetical protein